jgi:hypothetical protein
LSLTVGGTGANLNATGGTSQFVTQPTTGAPLSLIQPDYSDLAGQNPATIYDGQTLVGKGLPSSVFQARQSLLANTTITGGILNAPPVGDYRVSVTLIGIVGSSGTGVVPECDFTYTRTQLF